MIKITCADCGHAGTYKTRALADYHFARHSCAVNRERRAKTQRRLARETASGERRDCCHKNVHHEHGERLAYALDKCRCRACRDANNEYARTQDRRKLYGREPNLVDATSAREHIKTLMAKGMGWKRIAVAAGVSNGTLTGILYGKNSHDPREIRAPRKRIRRSIAQRILSVRLDLAPAARVDGTGTRRRVQALIAIGWTQTELANRLGWSGVQNFSAQLVHGHSRVLVTTRDKVAALYDELWNLPQHGYGADRARRVAARHGWAPPLAWDDDEIDKPEAKPDLGTDWRRRKDQRVDLAAILDLLTIEPGIRLDAAAHRLGVRPDTVEQTCHRAGRRDIIARLKRPDDAPLHRSA